MVDPQEIIEEARTWIGTPFVHQQSVKGHGVDCVGLIKGVAEAKGMQVDPLIWRRFQNYSRVPNPNRMLEALRLFLIPVERDDMRLADVLYLQWRDDLPTHLAFLADFKGRPTLIHALREIGRACEHGYVDPWPGRLNSVWRLPIARSD